MGDLTRVLGEVDRIASELWLPAYQHHAAAREAEQGRLQRIAKATAHELRISFVKR